MKKLNKYFQTRSLREIKLNLCLVTQISERVRSFNKRHGEGFTIVRKCLRLNIISGLFVEQSLLSATFHKKLDILERLSLSFYKVLEIKKKYATFSINFYIWTRDMKRNSVSLLNQNNRLLFTVKKNCAKGILSNSSKSQMPYRSS